MSSDIVRLEFVPIINIRGKGQANVSKIPTNSNVLFDNDVNNDKQKKQFKNCANETPPKKVCLSRVNINSIRNNSDGLLKFTYGLVTNLSPTIHHFADDTNLFCLSNLLF